MKMQFVLAICALAFCAHASAAGGAFEPYLEHAAIGARAMQLQPLSGDAEGFDPGTREARIWIGFSGFSPETMIRVVWRPGAKVDIGHYEFYEASFRTDPDPDNLFQAFAKKCRPVGSADGIEACRHVRAQRASNTVLARKLGEFGLWDLPDEHTVPGNPGDMQMVDGVAMLVELRDRTGYRSYAWSNPSARIGQQARLAERLMRYVIQLAHQDD